MKNLYVALIGDIVRSRSINNRNEIQLNLENVFTKINTNYEQFIVSKFLITIGDEFQGLLKPSAPIYEIITTIIESIYPLQIRFGLGLGGITTPIKDMALGMDGPAFYSARESLNLAYKKKEHAIVFKSDTIDKKTENTINMMFSSLAIIRKLWSKSFCEILPYLRTGKTQKEIASTIKATQPYVSKLIKNAYWKEVKILEEQIAQLLKFYLMKQNPL